MTTTREKGREVFMRQGKARRAVEHGFGKDEKPMGIKAKLKDGAEKSKKAAAKVPTTPKKAKETVID